MFQTYRSSIMLKKKCYFFILPDFTEVSCALSARPHLNWIVTVISTCVTVKSLSAMKEMQI